MPSMATFGNDHLQNITMGKIHLPLKTIACQELLRKPGIACKGWLRRKKPWKIPGSLGVLLQSIAWDRKYVIIHDGCMYFYNNESDNKPEKAISLFGYTRVMRAGEIPMGREAPWPFKVAYVLDEKDRVHYFSASCQEEMMNWLKHIKRELYKANGVEYSEDSVIDEDIHDLETPISTGNYFSNIKDLKKITEVVKVDDDSDFDDDYDYIEPDEPPSSKFSALITKSSGAKVTGPPKKGKTDFQNTESPKSSTPTPFPGYYPPFLKSDKTTSAKPLPTVPSAKPLPAAPIKKLPLKPIVSQTPTTSKVPPATPIKTKPKTPEAVSSDNSETTRSRNSSEGSSSSGSSVANLRQAFSNQMANASKSSPFSKPSAESSASSTSKPLPPLPMSSKQTSRAPTAIVSPVRQSENQSNRFTRDLESEAMWTQSPGEGQRFLVTLGQEGVYMLRQCTDGSSTLTLLVIAECQLRKYKIFKDARGMFSLLTSFDPRFDSIHNLLNHYRTNCLPMRQTTLTSAFSTFSGA